MALSEVRPGLNYSEAPKFSANPLARVIEEEIEKKGPIPFDKYMSAWLYGARTREGVTIPGYYTSGEAIIGNKEGSLNNDEHDFNTPSERTPLFGYCMAIQLLEMRKELGDPRDFTIVEMGAGNGTLAYDILHGIKNRVENGLADESALGAKYIIAERSQALIERQKERLKDFSDQVEFIEATADQLPLKDINGVFLSVELPDAFPTHIVRKDNEGKIEELFIDKGDNIGFSENWSPNLTDEAATYLKKYKPEFNDDYASINIASERWIKELGRALQRGFVLTVDYADSGEEPVRLFGSVDKLWRNTSEQEYLNKAIFGKTDMTQGVDFDMLAKAGNSVGLNSIGKADMHKFLWSLNMKSYLHPELKNISFGDREYDFYSAIGLYQGDGWDVMIHSKGLDRKPGFIANW